MTENLFDCLEELRLSKVTESKVSEEEERQSEIRVMRLTSS